MFRTCLINMPFANFLQPSIALTQIRAQVLSQCPAEVTAEIHYLTSDFAAYLGIARYHYISTSMQALYAGLGDWFFRQQAFPELPDNTEAYLRRYFWGKDPVVQEVKDLISKRRPGLGEFLDELIDKYDLAGASVVGFTSMFMQNAASFALARKLKQRNPDIITVLGGANCEYPMGKIIAENVPNIDFVFSGPALKNFPEFVRCCFDGESPKHRSFAGVFFKGSSTGTPVAGEELSIDAAVELNYDDFVRQFESLFTGKEYKLVMPFETSRGCWWGQRAHCTFCGLNGASMAYRAMKPELAIRQFKSLFAYADKFPLMEAVDNILPKEYLQQVLPYIDTPESVQIFYEVKADLSEQDMATLAKARVKRIQPGIESLATSTLKLMKKGTTAFQNLNFLKLCALYGVKPYWNLLVGFPGEGADVYRRYLEIIPHLVHLEPPSGVFPIRFDRFSPYHKQAKEYELDLRPMEFYSFVYPFDKASLDEFAYYFTDANLVAEYFTTLVQWIAKLQASVAQWQVRWKDPKNSAPPRLYVKDCGDIVYDSRYGAPAEYRIEGVDRAILQHAVRPTRLEELVKVCSPEFGSETEKHVRALESKGLLFREGDRLMSLVLTERGVDAPKPAPRLTGATELRVLASV